MGTVTLFNQIIGCASKQKKNKTIGQLGSLGFRLTSRVKQSIKLLCLGWSKNKGGGGMGGFKVI